MAAMDPLHSLQFRTDLRTAQQDVAHGVVAARARSAQQAWHHWESFCHTLRLHPTLDQVQDPIPILQVYALRYRRGDITSRHQPV